MKIWLGYTVLNLLDAGWLLAMALICVITFAVSSVFVNLHREEGS